MGDKAVGLSLVTMLAAYPYPTLFTCVSGINMFLMQVCEDLKAILRIQGCEFFRASVNRPNLFYEVRGSRGAFKCQGGWVSGTCATAHTSDPNLWMRSKSHSTSLGM